MLLICFLILFAQLNNLQVRDSARLDANPLNHTLPPNAPSPFFQPRGEIITADGVVIASSRRTHDVYKYLRVYPQSTAVMFSDITGYYANAVSAYAFGVEDSYNSYLEEHPVAQGSLGAVLHQKDETDNVYLTLSEKLQAAAMQALDSSSVKDGGAIVALDPQTGAVLAMYGYPNFNPNRFAVHDPAAVDRLVAEDNRVAARTGLDPRANYAISVTHPPGSTMKVVTTSAVYDHDRGIALQFFKPVSSITFPNSPGAKRLQNYGGEVCPANGGYLPQILAYSCDTAYAQIGYELGYTSWSKEAEAFGFCLGSKRNPDLCSKPADIPPIDLPDAAPSLIAPSSIDGQNPLEGYSAIGQFDDQATVLEMAMVASAIADGGEIMAPHVVDKIVNPYGETEFHYQPHVWRRATTADTAAKVRSLMTGVTLTQGATAQALFSSWYAQGGPTIAAKTGTAEPFENTCATDNWLIALGPAGKNQTPSVAVAAMIPVSPSECTGTPLSEPTGATVAGPVLLPVLKAALALQGGY
jgi:penicillin-binding protein A